MKLHLLLAIFALVCPISTLKVTEDNKAFLEAYKSGKESKRIDFIKKYFSEEDSLLDHVEYTNFLTDYLEHHVGEFEDDEELQEEAKQHHKELAEKYITIHAKEG